MLRGDITDEESWFHPILLEGCQLKSLKTILIEQAEMKNWGLTPFNFTAWKRSFPNLKCLRITTLFHADPISDIDKMLCIIADLFTTWPTLDAVIRFTVVNIDSVNGRREVCDFTEEQKEAVFLLTETNLRSLLSNVAQVVIKDGENQLKTYEILSTGRSHIRLKFALLKPPGLNGSANRFISADGK